MSSPFQTGSGRNATARQQQGFTLIEILVVIAIVTLLAGILFSAFSAARESGRTSSCASNLKQIGLAIAMYANDNRGHYPNNFEAFGFGRASLCPWPDMLLTYTRTTTVFICPSTHNMPYVPGCRPVPPPIDASITEGPIDEPLNDYSGPVQYNGAYDMNLFSINEFVGESRLRHPTTTISVLDGEGHMIFPAFHPPVESTSFTFDNPRHHGGNNALFVDGHVKWMTADSLKDPSWWPIGNPTN